MTTGEQGQLATILEGGTAVGLGPAELLARFAASRDEGAFAALVDRHGPMVLATCRRVLPNAADADDAFQATFLVLARKAGAIADPDRLAPWLHGVARRVAVRARSQAARRPEVTDEGHGDLAVAPIAADAELRAVLDEELARLPIRYRDPLVLCYLDGLTHDEAASQLHWPVGTVRSRLAGGRDRLRSRLARRGFAPGALAVLSPAALPVSAVSRPLLVATVRLVVTGSAGKVATSAAVLAQGVLTSMFLTKIQTTAVVALGVATTLAVGTVGVLAQQQSAIETANPPTAEPSRQQSAIEKTANPKLAQVPTAVGAITDVRNLPPAARNYEEALARIKALEAELAAVRRSLPSVGTNESVTAPLLVPGTSNSPAPNADRVASDPFGGLSVVPIRNSGKVALLPPDGRQISVIDTATGLKATYRPPGTGTQVDPIYGQNVIGLHLNGDKITQLAAYSATHGTEWVTQNLVEPAPGSAIQVSVSPGHVQYLVGRHLYLFGHEANSWAVAELQDPQGIRERWGQNGAARGTSECVVIPDGNQIHTYNFKTGVLEQTSLKDNPDPPRDQPVPAPPAVLPDRERPRPPEPAPTMETLEGSPTILMVIAGTRDRITMINPTTQQRATLRLDLPAEIISPISNSPPRLSGGFAKRPDQDLIEGLIGLEIVGPKLTKAAIFDRNAMRWFEHDLPQPASRVRTRMSGYSTLVGVEALYLAPTSSLIAFDAKDRTWPTITLAGPVKGYTPTDVSIYGTVAYEAGRYLPIYNQAARKWSVLEFRANGSRGTAPDFAVHAVHEDVREPHNGKLLIAEGDTFHIYDLQTAEWTHIDTRDDK